MRGHVERGHMDKRPGFPAGHQHLCLRHVGKAILDITALGTLTAERSHRSDPRVQCRGSRTALLNSAKLQNYEKYWSIIILGHPGWLAMKHCISEAVGPFILSGCRWVRCRMGDRVGMEAFHIRKLRPWLSIFFVRTHFLSVGNNPQTLYNVKNIYKIHCSCTTNIIRGVTFSCSKYTLY